MKGMKGYDDVECLSGMSGRTAKRRPTDIRAAKRSFGSTSGRTPNKTAPFRGLQLRRP